MKLLAFTVLATTIGITSAEQLLRDTKQPHDEGVVANDGAATIVAALRVCQTLFVSFSNDIFQCVYAPYV